MLLGMKALLPRKAAFHQIAYPALAPRVWLRMSNTKTLCRLGDVDSANYNCIYRYQITNDRCFGTYMCVIIKGPTWNM